MPILQTLLLAATLQASPAPLSPACALGAQLIAENVTRGNTVFDGEGQAGFLFDIAKDRMPPPLRAAVRARPPTNLFQACPALVDRLPAGARMATPQDLAEIKGIQRITGVYVTTLAAPVIDHAGRMAAVEEHSKCAGLCGFGGLFLYDRKAGRWTRGKPVVTMVS